MQKISILKDDYERYSFSIPLINIFGKRRNKYIAGELEQRHPCFSDDFSFDSALKVTRKGILSDVIVINKYRLAEYRTRAKWWNSFFFIEQCRKIWFPSKQIRNMFFLSLLVVITFLFFLVFGQSRSMQRKKQSALETSIMSDSTTQIDSIEETVPSEKMGKLFIEKVMQSHGKLKSLYWTVDGDKEKVKALVNGIHPETLMEVARDINLSSVLYEKGNPEFEISINEKAARSFNKRMPGDVGSYKQQLRECLEKRNIAIQEERYSPYVLKFSLENDFSVLQDFDCICEENNLGISSLILLSGDKGELKTEISVSELMDYKSGIPAGYLTDYSGVFSENDKPASANKSPVKKAPVNKGAGSLEKGLIKIGEVKYEGGKSLVFYKDASGKLIKRLEGE